MAKSKAQGKRPEGRAEALENGEQTVGEFPSRAHQFTSDNQPEGRGRPKGLRNSKTILRELLQFTEEARSPITGETGEVSQLDLILTKLVVMAKHGDLASVDRVLDRLEGRPETTSKTVNLNIEAKPDELEKLTDDQIARMASIAKESSNG